MLGDVQTGRARRADRLRRPAGDRADHPRETARRLPARRISARARHDRHGRPPRDLRETLALLIAYLAPEQEEGGVNSCSSLRSAASWGGGPSNEDSMVEGHGAKPLHQLRWSPSPSLRAGRNKPWTSPRPPTAASRPSSTAARRRAAGDILGLDRIRRALRPPRRPAAPPAPRVPRRRNQRQGLDLRLAARRDRSRRRHRPRLHLAASGALQRAHPHRRKADRGRRNSRRCSNEVIDAGDGLDASFFEVATAAAFLAFARTPADAAMIEVGLGGRLDATNVVDRPSSPASPRSASTTRTCSATRSSRSRSRKPASPSPACRSSCSTYPPEANAVIASQADKVGAPLIARGRAGTARRGHRLRNPGYANWSLARAPCCATSRAVALLSISRVATAALRLARAAAAARPAHWSRALASAGYGSTAATTPEGAEQTRRRFRRPADPHRRPARQPRSRRGARPFAGKVARFVRATDHRPRRPFARALAAAADQLFGHDDSIAASSIEQGFAELRALDPRLPVRRHGLALPRRRSAAGERDHSRLIGGGLLARIALAFDPRGAHRAIDQPAAHHPPEQQDARHRGRDVVSR